LTAVVASLILYYCLHRDLTDVYLLYVAFRYCISVFRSHREYAV